MHQMATEKHAANALGTGISQFATTDKPRHNILHYRHVHIHELIHVSYKIIRRAHYTVTLPLCNGCSDWDFHPKLFETDGTFVIIIWYSFRNGIFANGRDGFLGNRKKNTAQAHNTINIHNGNDCIVSAILFVKYIIVAYIPGSYSLGIYWIL